MKYIDAEKLIAEIERWRDKAKEKYNESTYSMGRCDALAEFRNHIDSLRQEQTERSLDLDNAALDYVRDYFCPGADFTPEYIKHLMEDAFVGGATWKEESLQKQEQPKGIDGVVHHYLNTHWIVTDKKQLATALKVFHEGAEVELFIFAKKEGAK